MAHCGFEPTAVNDAVSHPLKALWIALRGPRTEGPMAPDPAISYAVPGSVEVSSPEREEPRRVA
jgi:hypothetical protein